MSITTIKSLLLGLIQWCNDHKAYGIFIILVCGLCFFASYSAYATSTNVKKSVDERYENIDNTLIGIQKSLIELNTDVKITKAQMGIVFDFVRGK